MLWLPAPTWIWLMQHQQRLFGLLCKKRAGCAVVKWQCAATNTNRFNNNVLWLFGIFYPHSLCSCYSPVPIRFGILSASNGCVSVNVCERRTAVSCAELCEWCICCTKEKRKGKWKFLREQYYAYTCIERSDWCQVVAHSVVFAFVWVCCYCVNVGYTWHTDTIVVQYRNQGQTIDCRCETLSFVRELPNR